MSNHKFHVARKKKQKLFTFIDKLFLSTCHYESDRSNALCGLQKACSQSPHPECVLYRPMKIRPNRFPCLKQTSPMSYRTN